MFNLHHNQPLDYFDGSSAARARKPDNSNNAEGWWRAHGVAFNWLDFPPVPGRGNCYWPLGTEPQDKSRIGWSYL